MCMNKDTKHLVVDWDIWQKSLNVIGIFLLIWKKVSQSSIKKKNFNLFFLK